jgi:mannose-1-phosphate guanylyltransferase
VIHQALVLTAGLGTRLRPLTDVRAKPAIPVAGDAMIRRIVAWLVSHGVDDLVLNLHHRPETLTAVLGDGADLGARVRYSWEQPRVLGSAGGPRLAQPIVGAETFLVVNGDTLTDLDLARFAGAHAGSGAAATLALVPNRDFTRYGGVRLDAEQRVVGFTPRGPGAEGSYHFIGVQMVEASAFEGVAAGEPASSIGGVYDALFAQQPGRVRGWVCDAAFWDVGTVADYWRTSAAFSANAIETGASEPHRPRIDASARVTRSILWDDVVVHADAVLDECIVTDGVVVPPGVQYRRSVVMAGDGDSPIVAGGLW